MHETLENEPAVAYLVKLAGQSPLLSRCTLLPMLKLYDVRDRLVFPGSVFRKNGDDPVPEASKAARAPRLDQITHVARPLVVDVPYVKCGSGDTPARPPEDVVEQAVVAAWEARVRRRILAAVDWAAAPDVEAVTPTVLDELLQDARARGWAQDRLTYLAFPATGPCVRAIEDATITGMPLVVCAVGRRILCLDMKVLYIGAVKFVVRTTVQRPTLCARAVLWMDVGYIDDQPPPARRLL